MCSIPTTLDSTATRSLKGSAEVATLTASLLSAGLHAADIYDSATGQVSAPVVKVGGDYYRDVVITVDSIVSIGEAAEGDAKYDKNSGDECILRDCNEFAVHVNWICMNQKVKKYRLLLPE